MNRTGGTSFPPEANDKPFTYQTGIKWHIFTNPELVGVAFTALAGFLSLCTIMLLLIYSLHNAFKSNQAQQRQLLPQTWRKSDASDTTHATSSMSASTLSGLGGEQAFWFKRIGIYVACLFLSDFIQAMAGTVQLHWLARGRIDDGKLCQFQGATLLLGDVGTAVWSAIIAVHTFVHIVLKTDFGNRLFVSTIVGGWAIAITFTIIGPIWISHTGDPWLGISGPWCFITSSYTVPRIIIHYVPLLISAFIILVLYSLIFLHLRGYLQYQHRRFRWDWKPDTLSIAGSSDRTSRVEYVRSMSIKMLWYPFSYIVLILQDTIFRLAALMGRTAADWWWYLGITMMFLIGFSNVIIYCTTRNILTPRRQSSYSGSQTTSFNGKTTTETAKRFGLKWAFSSINSRTSSHSKHGSLTPTPYPCHTRQKSAVSSTTPLMTIPTSPPPISPPSTADLHVASIWVSGPEDEKNHEELLHSSNPYAPFGHSDSPRQSSRNLLSRPPSPAPTAKTSTTLHLPPFTPSALTAPSNFLNLATRPIIISSSTSTERRPPVPDVPSSSLSPISSYAGDVTARLPPLQSRWWDSDPTEAR